MQLFWLKIIVAGVLIVSVVFAFKIKLLHAGRSIIDKRNEKMFKEISVMPSAMNRSIICKLFYLHSVSPIRLDGFEPWTSGVENNCA